MPVSLKPDEEKWVNERVENLRPHVANRSHYVKLLIDWDRRHNLLGPKSQPVPQLDGVAIAA